MSFNLTPIVRNLLIANFIFFFARYFIGNQAGIDINNYLGLHSVLSQHFQPFQFVTYMFMHGDFGHILSNMFGLFMFGPLLEKAWGPKRFLMFYMITGIGAGALYSLINYFEMLPYQGLDFPIYAHMVGASGAIFGILMAFGMLFPNTEIFLLFFPFPIKAKYFVALYGLYELFAGIRSVPGDNIAHFAHLAGMLVAFILIKIWKKRKNSFY